jgi:hypothetical protein
MVIILRHHARKEEAPVKPPVLMYVAAKLSPVNKTMRITNIVHSEGGAEMT